MPTMRGRNHVDAASGTMPMRPNTKPIRARVDAMRASIGSVIVAPMPTAAPLIAAMTGLVQRWTASDTRPPVSRTPSRICGSSARVRRSASVGLSDSSSPKTLPSPFRSMPAQKALPEPVTTMARTASSALARSYAEMSSLAMVTVKALRWSGRLRVNVRMPSWTVQPRVSKSMISPDF